MPMIRVARRDAITKKDFHARLRAFLRDTADSTVGAGIVGVSAWVHVRDGDMLFRLNSDAWRDAVAKYLAMVDQHGDSMLWTVVPNQRGRINALVYGPDRIRLASFYLYLVDDQQVIIDAPKTESLEPVAIEGPPRANQRSLQPDSNPSIAAMPNLLRFKRHRDAERHIASAIAVIKALLPLNLYPGHLEQFLSRALWKITEAEAGGKSGKLRIRYRSKASLSPTHGKLQHEHVYQQKRMIAELIAHPNRVEDIVKKAVACVVTKDEHRRLHSVASSSYGWERYIQAEIAVIDTATAEQVDLHRLAAETRSS